MRTSARRDVLAYCGVVTPVAMAVAALLVVLCASYGVLRPLWPDGRESSVFVFEGRGQTKGGPVQPVSYGDVKRVDAQNSTLSGAAAMSFVQPWRVTVGDRMLTHVPGVLATSQFARVLDLQLVRGRAFDQADEASCQEVHVLVTEDFWRQALGGNESTVGLSFSLNGSPAQIVGIIRSIPAWLTSGAPPAVIGPLACGDTLAAGPPHSGNWSTGARFLLGLGRLRHGVPLSGAKADLTRIADTAVLGAAQEFVVFTPREFVLATVGGVPLKSAVLMMCFGIVMLLIACTNACAILLLRLQTNQAELLTRVILGAHPLLLIRRECLRGVILGCGSAFVGALLGEGVVRLLESQGQQSLRFQPSSTPFSLIATPYGLLGTCVILAVCAVCMAAVPAGRVKRLVSQAWHGRGGVPVKSSRVLATARRTYVIAQVAVSLALVTIALLVDQSLRNELSLPLGFDDRGNYEVDVRLSRRMDPNIGVDTATTIANAARGLPGVRASAVATFVPPQDSRQMAAIRTGEGPANHILSASVDEVSPAFFSLLGIKIDRGRDFDDGDVAGAPRVAIVSASFVRSAWPNGEPIGRPIFRLGEGANSPIRVVGVVNDVRSFELLRRPEPAVYLPLGQGVDDLAEFQLVVHSDGMFARTAPMLEALVRHASVDAKVASVEALSTKIADRFADERSLALILTVGAAATVIQALAGMLALSLYGSGLRAREYSIRSAVGASRQSLAVLALRENAKMVLIGLALGIVVVGYGKQLVASFLFGAVPTGLHVGLEIGCALGITVLASALPAVFRAASTDPAALLREQ